MAKLQLLADVYNQRVNPDDPRDDLTTVIRKGDLFEPKNQAEADRLDEIGAAVDPKRAQQLEAEKLQGERDRLEARKAELDRQLAELPPSEDPSELKGEALDEALDRAGLSKDGKADEKRARLAEHLQSQE